MKTGIRMIAFALIASIALLIVMSVMGRMNRSMEVKSNLSSAVEETVENLAVKKYAVSDMEEYLADFNEALMDFIDTDSEITVQVAGADTEKGILAVKVTETFAHPNGRTGTVSCERVVIFNRLEEEGL